MPVGWHDAAGEGRKRERGGCSTPIGRQRPSQQRPEAGRRGRHGVAMPHNWPEQGRGGGGGRPMGSSGTLPVGVGQTLFKPFQNSLNRFKQTSNCANFI
jgi:hypothetical protein